jgi:hypothetical protein
LNLELLTGGQGSWIYFPSAGNHQKKYAAFKEIVVLKKVNAVALIRPSASIRVV